VVAIGLLTNGVAMYAFVVLAQRLLDEDSYSALSVLWGLTFFVGPGVFLPLEQEVSRALASRRSRNVGALPLIRKAARLGAILGAVLLGGVAVTNDWLANELFEGNRLLVAALGLSFAAFGVELLVRGTLSGVGRFGDYAGVLGLEGTARFLIAAVLALVGVEAVGPYGLALALGPLVAAGFVLLPGRGATLTDGPPASYSELSASLAFLLAGSVMTLGLMNIGPATVQLLSGDDADALPGQLLNALVVARVPLFLFQAVQAALLPSLADHAGAGRFAEFRAGLRPLLGAVAAVGAAGVTGSLIAGPLVASIMFEGDQLGRGDFLLLSVSMALLMMAMALGQALIALHHERRVAAVWAVAVTAFVLSVVLVDAQVLRRVEVALVIASVVAALGLLATLRSDPRWREARTSEVMAAAH
jgi:O-antigen/teichoic acid export membrane protein